MENNKKILGLVLAVLVIILIALLISKSRSNDASNAQNNGTGTTTGAGVSARAPSLDRQLVIPKEYSKIIKSKIEAGVQSAISKIKSDPDNIDNWFNLALWYKMANDYLGAEEIWLYVSKINPENRTAQSNLGDLYKNSLIDYAKAEAAWLRVVAIDPTYIDAYNELYLLYRYNISEKTAEASKILMTGIEKTKSPTLMYQLSEYYGSIPNKPLAIEWYNKTKTAAKSIGDTKLMKSVDEALSKLK
ncbi:MAG: hypothetical protein HZA95_02460 [Candidatus Vogelbacteria bacterium]|nr:hypothetical protein [Candidatus Vogelbacteria bacterium]